MQRHSGEMVSKSKSGERPYKCNQCDFAASQKSGLDSHVIFTLVKSHISATNATTQLLRKAIWTVISEFTLVKSHTSATNANTHLLTKAV